MYCYTGIFSGIPLSIAFRFRGTAAFYKGFLQPCSNSADCITIPEEDIAQWQTQWKCPDSAYAEYVISCSYICDALMRRNRLVFHGASYLWRKRAYIFSAPSGTGKTTQITHWRSLYGQGIEILNGDKPILEVSGNGEISVHPSPWKGKEGLGRDDITAPLGGIILLRQDTQNHIEKIKPTEAARNLFGRIYSTFSTVEDVLLAADLMEQILSVTPVWMLSNRGDEDSAELTYKTLLEEVNE